MLCKLLASILSLLMVIGIAEGGDQEAFQDLSFNSACAAAQQENKVVMIDFFATWCGPCKMLDQTTWKDEDVRVWLREKTVAIKIDAEKTVELARQYRIQAYPTIVFLKPDGTEIDRLLGYRNPAQFLSEANNLLASKNIIGRRKPAAPLEISPTRSKTGDLNQFSGKWRNIDSNTRGITALDIRVNGTNVMVQAWGKCHPSDCDWGRVDANAYAPNVSSNLADTAQTLSAIFQTGFGQTLMVIHREGKEYLQAEVLTRFTDHSGRANYREVYTFARSDPFSP